MGASVGWTMDSDAGKPLLDGIRPPKRDERSPPDVEVDSSAVVVCAGADGDDEVVGTTISEDGGKTPVEASVGRWATVLVRASVSVLAEVGRMISEVAGRSPVGATEDRCVA